MEQAVIENITNFYYATNEADRKVAETFLTAFQKSSESWQICRGIMLNQPLASVSAAAVRLFAATTLSNKILYSHGDLSTTGRAELKSFLLLAAHAFDEAPPGGDAGSALKIVGLLCKSLACLAALTPEWKVCIFLKGVLRKGRGAVAGGVAGRGAPWAAAGDLDSAAARVSHSEAASRLSDSGRGDGGLPDRGVGDAGGFRGEDLLRGVRAVCCEGSDWGV